MKISAVWCGLAAPEGEADYRDYYLSTDICQLIIGLSIWALPFLAFSLIDYQAASGHPILSVFVLLRVIYTILSTTVLIAFRKRIHQPALFDRIVIALALVTVLFNIFINLLRPVAFLPGYLFDLLMVFSCYVLLPNILAVRAAPAVLLSLCNLWIIWIMQQPGLSLPDRQALSIAFVLGNLVGLIFSERLLQGRLTEFLARRQAEASRQDLERLASIDALTGVFNRRRLMELASEEFYRFRRYGRSFSLALIDVDGFKRVNDTFGHSLGDTVLVQFAQMIQCNKREADSIGRIGGDEFCLVLPETQPHRAANMAKRILLQCEKMEIAGKALDIHISASIGVTQVKPEDESIDTVLARADVALYRAKNEGRNRVVLN